MTSAVLPECIRSGFEQGGRLCVLGDLYLENETLHVTNWGEAIRYLDPITGAYAYYSPAPFAISDDGIVHDPEEISVLRIILGLIHGEDDAINYTDAQREQFSETMSELEEYLDRHDIRGCYACMRIVNPDNLADHWPFFSGQVDDFGFSDAGLTLEISSASDSLAAWAFPISTNCPYVFGDDLCGVDRDSADNLYEGTADSGSTASLVCAAITPATENYWFPAVVEITSGDNEGAIREVKSYTHSTDTIVPVVAWDYAIAAGDGFKLRRICKKTFSHCKSLNANPERFGGYPYATDKVQGLYWRGKG